MIKIDNSDKSTSNNVKKKDIKLTSFGAAIDVGKSCFLIEQDGRKILIEAGLQLNPRRTKLLSNAPIGVDEVAHELDSVLLSHAHLDHSGYIPALYENGYQGHIYTTKPTIPITKILWRDHLKIEGEHHYSRESFNLASGSFKGFEYNKKIKIAEGIFVEFINAGHVLGSSSVLIDFDGTLIYYSGDINDQPSAFHNKFDLPNEPVETLLVETTNSNRKIPKRQPVVTSLIDTVKTSLRKKGKKIIIPSFAFGRSQDILMYLLDLLDDDLYSYNVYIDGMINQMNRIYEKFLTKEWVSPRVLDVLNDFGLSSPFSFHGFKPITKDTISNIGKYRNSIINSKRSAVIITTSGMLEGGPILSYLSEQNQNGNILAFVGYQVDGTIGNSILNGETVLQAETPWGTKQTLNITNKIKKFDFSGHASQEGIRSFILGSGSKNVFGMHGNLSDQQYFAKQLNKNDNILLQNFSIDVPVFQ